MKEDYSKEIEKVLNENGISFEIENKKFGKSYSQYTIQCNKKDVNKIAKLANDIALSVQSYKPIRMIKGEKQIIIEIINKKFEYVELKDVLFNDNKCNSKSLQFYLGEDIDGNCVKGNLSNYETSTLIGGTTGSGKSMFLNALITSLAINHSPKELQFLLIDCKSVDMDYYKKLPHLYDNKIVNEHTEAFESLKKITEEMEKRYGLFCINKVKNIDKYNSLENIEKLPEIVIIIDELADFMYGKFKNELEYYIRIIACKGRAVGIHLVMASQRVCNNVITKSIQACASRKIAFTLIDKSDSRLLIEENDAVCLGGRGEMITKLKDEKSQRLKSYYISSSEIKMIVDYLANYSGNYDENILKNLEEYYNKWRLEQSTNI